MDLYLKNKKAIVCASSQGLGLAVAETLAKEGAVLVVNGRDQGKIDRVAKHLEDSYQCTVYAIAADLSIPGNVGEFMDQAINKLGGVDILVNNIGGPPPSAAQDTSAEMWLKGFEQVFMSSTLATQYAVKEMKKNQFGRIINITSLSVLEPIDHLVVSTAMRAGVTTFAKTLAKEVAGNGITINTVMPGIIKTDRIVNLRKAKAERSGTTLEQEMDNTTSAIPMGRLGRPEELADLVGFLASEKSSYITGANIPVDGGYRKGW